MHNLVESKYSRNVSYVHLHKKDATIVTKADMIQLFIYIKTKTVHRTVETLSLVSHLHTVHNIKDLQKSKPLQSFKYK